MKLINDQHMKFLVKGPATSFCREHKIKFSSLSQVKLYEKLNTMYENNEIDPDLLKDKLYTWLYQGRKKIVFTYINPLELEEYKHTQTLQTRIAQNFALSHELTGIENINIHSEIMRHLIDIRYYSENAVITDLTSVNSIDKVVFFYINIVKQIERDETGDKESIICLPIHVEIDLKNNMAMSRAGTKNNIYYARTNEKTNEFFIAQNCLDTVLRSLNIHSHADIKADIKSTIYNVHQSLTALPDEVTASIQDINDITDTYVDEAKDLLDLDLTSNNKQDISSSIKHLFIKEIIKSYSEDDSELFTNNKPGYSIGISASSRGLSSVKHTSPGHIPLQLDPSYQNTRAIVDETETIEKNIIYWFSVVSDDDSIRSKLFTSVNGYGIISFEQYVYEEDIQNVLSEIRNARPTR